MRAAGDPDLKMYGIFGYPLAHTASPAIQNQAFDYYQLKSFYFAFERPPARFRFLMNNLKSLVLDGFNVTVPYKETIIPYLDRLTPEAKAAGAVNTVKKEKRKWVGYNTDLYGFLTGLKQIKFSPRGKSVLILGAGGSARAVGFSLAKNGVRRIFVTNRTLSRAESLIEKLRKTFPKTEYIKLVLNDENLKKALSQVDLLVNATKIGLHPKDQSLVRSNVFPKRRILVYDLIYKPAETKLLKLAKRLGHKTLNGETMLLYQGAKAFEIWTGKKAPIPEMKKALHDAIYAR